MSVYASEQIDKIVAIDEAHAQLLTSLVMARKPNAVLEFGFGTGESCWAILRALRFNATPFRYELVDSWSDWSGSPPAEIQKPEYAEVQFITSGEQEYVAACSTKYQFIFSDADHRNTQRWFDYVYDNILDNEGILIYHDVTNSNMFPNLLSIYTDTVHKDYHHMLFNYNSRGEERCDRGMLIIFKH